MPLPPFTPEGLLPPGDDQLTLSELRESFLVTGHGVQSEHWDAAWRGHLVDNLEILIGQLRRISVGRIFIDGSFVEDKDHPHDVDGYFECDVRYFASRQLEHDLNALDPDHVWTWDPRARRPDPNSTKAQLPILRGDHDRGSRPVRERAAVPIPVPTIAASLPAERYRRDRPMMVWPPARQFSRGG